MGYHGVVERIGVFWFRLIAANISFTENRGARS
jgi:hypothetical protein